MSDSNFYRAFEDRYRGSRELIIQRCENYKDYLSPLLAVYQPAQLQDLGCGRGEWLEYTQEIGFTVHGVDLDAGMLEACIERNLSVSQEDAITRLKSLPDNSQAVVSGFHIVEHIPFEVLQQLAQEALRVLQPGGLLILETPNPENLVVGTSSFYLDPTHQTPIPPLLLSFVAEYTGFYRVKVVRLQEDPELTMQKRSPGLMDVLGAVSPDYAVIAQKAAEPGVLEKFDKCFVKEQGLTLDVLAQRYDKQHNKRLDALENRFNKMTAETETRLKEQADWYESVIKRLTSELKVPGEQGGPYQSGITGLVSELKTLKEQLSSRDLNQASLLEEQQKRLESVTEQLNESLANAHHWYLRATAAEQRVHDTLHSASWRITAPLRGLRNLMVWLLQLPVRMAKAIALPFVMAAMKFALKRPQMCARWEYRLRQYPTLYAHIRQFLLHRGLIEGQSEPVVTTDPERVELQDLTPRARQIYQELQDAIAKNREKK